MTATNPPSNPHHESLGAAAHRAPELVASHWFNTPQPITLEGLRGKVVVIEAFQMLCPGCVSHGLPQAQRIAEVFNPADVSVIGLHSVFEHHTAQGTRAALEAFLHEYRIRFPVGIDAAASAGTIPQTMQAYQLRGTPSLILIDRQGIRREQHFGSVSDVAIGAQVMQLVAEKIDDSYTKDSANAAPGQRMPACDSDGCSIEPSE